MKKALLVLGTILVLLLSALLILPYVFKPKLIAYSEQALNEQLNIRVDVKDAGISFFADFPKVQVALESVTLVGVGEFENDTLFEVDRVSSSIDLFSLFNPGDISIKEVLVSRPLMNLKVNAEGKANWDIVRIGESEMIASSEVSADSVGAGGVSLESIRIEEGRLIYDDASTLVKVGLDHFDFQLAGRLDAATTQLKVEGKVDNFTLAYDSANYLSGVQLGLKSDLNIDFNRMLIGISEGSFSFNQLPMELDGKISMPSDTVNLDLSLRTPKSDFKSFLGLLPKEYEPFLQGIQASGKASLEGKISGIYFDEDYPAFSLTLNVTNGEVQYPDLPKSIRAIHVNGKIGKPQGDLDLLQIQVAKAHAEVGNNPIDFSLLIRNLMTDPHLSATLAGTFNFEELKDALPLDSLEVGGILKGNVELSGNYSAVEKQLYNQMKVNGRITLNDFSFASPDYTMPVTVSSGSLAFSPQSVRLESCDVLIGQSDFHLTGALSNYLNYTLAEGVLKGRLMLNSDFVNLDQLARFQRPDSTAVQSDAQADEEVLAFDVPAGIDVIFESQIKRAVFNGLPMENIQGRLHAVNRQLLLEDLNINTLKGNVTVNGMYRNTEENKPLFDVKLAINEFDIPMLFSTVSGMQKLIPGGHNSTGRLSSTLSLAGQLTSNFSLVPTSVNGKGLLSTKNVVIHNSSLFRQLAGILKKEKLNDVTVSDFVASLTVENGNIRLKPFNTKIIGQETRIEGSLNPQSLIDMRLDFNIQRELFGPDLEKFLKLVPGNQKITMLPAGVKLTGPVGKSKVSFDLSDTQKVIKEATKDDLNKSLNKLEKGIKKLFK